MIQPTSVPYQFIDYQHIPDFEPGMVLPDKFTVLYVRLSKEDRDKAKKGDDSNSIVNQKKLLANHAQKLGLPNPVFFIDDDYSGTNFDRPGFHAALELVEAGQVANFVVKDMIRFGRNATFVGLYTEYTFTEMDVRFIAILNNVDSAIRPISDEDALPFLNAANEIHCRSLSKNIKSVLHGKGEDGEPMSPHAPYGYRKDPDDKKKWIIDEEAAEVVRQIFQWYMEGLGVSHIANRLREAKIERPFVYFQRMGFRKDKRVFPDPYDWGNVVVGNILERQEYLGHVVNFKTYRKSYKHPKTLFHDPSEYLIFENKHPAIIDQETFNRVQELRKSKKRRRTKSGRVNLFAGLVFCADCGSNMFLSSGISKKPEQDNYSCSGFCTKKTGCESSHYIRRVVLEQKVLEHIQNVTVFAAEHEDELTRKLEARNATRLQKDLSADKKCLAQSERRIQELDSIIQGLIEKNVLGVISDERYVKVSQGYELEQKELKAKIQSLQTRIAEEQESRAGVDTFLTQVRKYTRVTELTPLMLNELVERIEIYAPDKSSGKRVQQIKVCFNYVGDIAKLGLQSETPIAGCMTKLLNEQLPALPAPFAHRMAT